MVVVRGVCVRRWSDRIGFVMEPFIWGLSRYGCSGESWIFARRDEFHAWHDMDLRKGDRIGMQSTFTLDEYRFPYVDNRVNAQLLIKSGLDELLLPCSILVWYVIPSFNVMTRPVSISDVQEKACRHP